MRDINPEMTVEDINDAVYGIDIHPLSVQIAKTTLLLALGKGVIGAKRPIHLNIILANTLLAPEGVEDLFGNEFTLPIDKEKYVLNTQVFEDVRMFDAALDAFYVYDYFHSDEHDGFAAVGKRRDYRAG